MPEEAESTGRRKVLVLAAVIVALFVGLIVVSAFHSGARYAPGEATGDDLDIRLVGVWPEESADIRDASGKIIGDTYGDFNWPQMIFKGKLYRRFLFELEDEGENIIFSLDIQCSPDGESSPRFPVFVFNEEDFSKGKRVFTPRTWVEKKYTTQRFAAVPFLRQFLPATKTHKVKSVDLTLRYYRGPRGEATYVFEGPFAAGGSVAAEEDARATLSISEYHENGGTWGTRLTFTPGTKETKSNEMVVYDRQETRLVSQNGGTTGMGSGKVLEYRLFGTAPEDIGTITIGETAREKTFHNILVAYPDKPEREYPEYLDEMAARLGLAEEKWEEARSLQFNSGEEVLPVVDVIRGSSILFANAALINLIEGYGERDLTSDERALLKEVFGKWAAERSMQVRATGVACGLRLDTDAFVDGALDIIESGPRWASAQVAWTLQENGWKCDDARVERVGRLLFESQAANCAPYLAESVATNGGQAARDILVRMAADDRPWLWWRALGMDAAKVALGERPDWPREIVAREILVNGLREEDAERDAEAFTEAQALLPTVITPDFALADEDSFKQALGLLMEKYDHEEATDVMMGFITEARDYGRLWPCILGMVSTINEWYGVDIGGIGRGTELEPGMGDLNWRQIAVEAAEWRKTGQVVMAIPVGYRASKGDIRVILYDEKEPERSLVSLYPDEGRPGVTGGVQRVSAPDRALVYTILHNVVTQGLPRVQTDHELRYQLSWKEEREDYFRQWTRSRMFTLSQLPVKTDEHTPPWVPFKVVVEDATSGKSVLSGTKVFEECWEKYGPSPAGE